MEVGKMPFHITFVLGQLTQKDPEAFFHIISKDTGFDPLIIYLKNQKIFCKRSDEISSIIKSQLFKQDENIALEDPYKVVFQKLASIDKKSRPKAEVTLKNYIKAQLCLKELTPVVNEVYQKLFNDKKVHLNQAKKIEYGF